MLLCGDNAEAKRAVEQLFETAGFFPIDLGDLVTGSGMQQAGGHWPDTTSCECPRPGNDGTAAPTEVR